MGKTDKARCDKRVGASRDRDLYLEARTEMRSMGRESGSRISVADELVHVVCVDQEKNGKHED